MAKVKGTPKNTPMHKLMAQGQMPKVSKKPTAKP